MFSNDLTARGIKNAKSYTRKIARHWYLGWQAGHRPVPLGSCVAIGLWLLCIFSDWKYMYIPLCLMVDLLLLLRCSDLWEVRPGTDINATNIKWASGINRFYGNGLRLLMSRLVWLYILPGLVSVDVNDEWTTIVAGYLGMWLFAPLLTCVYLFEPVTITNGMSYGNRFEYFSCRWAYFSGYAALTWVLLPLIWLDVFSVNIFVVYMGYLAFADGTEHNKVKPASAKYVPYIRQTLATDPLEALDSALAKRMC